MLVSDLHLRASRFEKEAAKKSALDQRKQEKDRIVRNRVAAKKAAHDLAVAEQAEKQRQADLAAEQQRNADTEHNNGVYIEATLQAVPLPLLTAAAKGVKRNADKIVLPAHLGAELMKQSAHEANGTAFWEVSAADGRSTCCSALDFSGPDGVVMLPPKVVHSLWGYNRPCQGQVRVKYKRLERGTFVRLTPQNSEFQSQVAEHMETLLQETLMQHTALSEGDWLEVPFDGVVHKLQVMELHPAAQVSLIDTDLSADVTESQEYLQRIQAEHEAAMNAAREEARQQEEAQRLQDMLRAHQQEADAKAALQAAEVALRRSELAASLPPEPSTDCSDGVISCRFQLPDGSKLHRRFKLSEGVRALFDFVEGCGAGGLQPESYRLVMQYPRRVLTEDSILTLQEAGLLSGQNMLLVEKL